MAKMSKTWSTRELGWYDEMKSIAPYIERQYEKIILKNLLTLFPDFYGVNYKLLIKATSEEKASRPDFALIHKDYTEWWIVEVETIGDDLHHVTRQIRNFKDGDYSARDQADYIYTIDPSLDSERLKTLTRDKPPKVLVIVDDINSKWSKALEEYASICVFKIFRNSKNYELLSISGEYPYITEDRSFFYFEDLYRGLIRLANPNVLEPPSQHRLSFGERTLRYAKGTMAYRFISERLLSSKQVESSESESVWATFQGQKYEFTKLKYDDQVYLRAVGPNPLRPDDSYILIRTKRFGYIIDRG